MELEEEGDPGNQDPDYQETLCRNPEPSLVAYVYPIPVNNCKKIG